MKGKNKNSTKPKVKDIEWLTLGKKDDHSGTPKEIKTSKYKVRPDVDGKKAGERLDKMKRGGKVKKKWIQDIDMNKGALHSSLGVPEDKKIPAKKLEKASHSENPTLRRRANLAKTLKKLH